MANNSSFPLDCSLLLNFLHVSSHLLLTSRVRQRRRLLVPAVVSFTRDSSTEMVLAEHQQEERVKAATKGTHPNPVLPLLLFAIDIHCVRTICFISKQRPIFIHLQQWGITLFGHPSSHSL